MAVQSDWLQKNYYDVFGVPETATDEEISRAYRRLARQLHPDVNPNNKDAEERFKEVSAACFRGQTGSAPVPLPGASPVGCSPGMMVLMLTGGYQETP